MNGLSRRLIPCLLLLLAAQACFLSPSPNLDILEPRGNVTVDGWITFRWRTNDKRSNDYEFAILIDKGRNVCDGRTELPQTVSGTCWTGPVGLGIGSCAEYGMTVTDPRGGTTCHPGGTVCVDISKPGPVDCGCIVEGSARLVRPPLCK